MSKVISIFLSLTVALFVATPSFSADPTPPPGYVPPQPNQFNSDGMLAFNPDGSPLAGFNPDGSVNRNVFFFTEDGGRYLTPAELPQVQICYAMTVHKSQGSEYENLLVILPGESSPLLTRELVYTAVTRAKKSLVIAGTSLAVLQAVNNQSVRYSGLKTLMSEYLS